MRGGYSTAGLRTPDGLDTASRWLWPDCQLTWYDWEGQVITL